MEYDNNEEHGIIFGYDNTETIKEEKEQRRSGRKMIKPEILDLMWHGNSMHKILHRIKLCIFITTNRV